MVDQAPEERPPSVCGRPGNRHGVRLYGVFHDSVAAYSVHELPARFDENALEAARAGLHETGLLLFGEQHGQPQTPRAVYTLMRRLSLRGLALEWEADLRPLVDGFLSEGLDATDALSEDGRVTAGHFAVLAKLRDEERLERLILMDETARDWTGHWSERDAGMARTLLRDRDPSVPTLVVAGGFHTTIGDEAEPTLAALLDRDVRGVPSGAFAYTESGVHEGRFERDEAGRLVFVLPS